MKQIIISISICILVYSCKKIETKNYASKTTDLVAIKKVEEKVINQEAIKTWQNFKEIVFAKNLAAFKKISFQEIHAGDSILKNEKFISQYFNRVFDKLLLEKLNDSLAVDYVEIDKLPSYLSKSNLEEVLVENQNLKIVQFQVLKKIDGDCGWSIMFDFTKTKNGYKFLGCDAICGGL